MHLEAVIEGFWRCTGRPWSSELRDALGGRNQASLEMHWRADIKLNSEMHLEAAINRVWRCIWRSRSSSSEIHLEAVMERVWRCTWRRWSSELRDALGGRNRASLEMHLEAKIKLNSDMHLEAVIKRVWRSTCRPSSSKIGGVLGGGR